MLLLVHAMQQRVQQILNFSFCFNPLLHAFFFRWFLRYSLRQAVIVHRLIDAAIIGNYFGHPLFQNRNSGQMLLLSHAMQQRVNSCFRVAKMENNNNYYIRRNECLR